MALFQPPAHETGGDAGKRSPVAGGSINGRDDGGGGSGGDSGGGDSSDSGGDWDTRSDLHCWMVVLCGRHRQRENVVASLAGFPQWPPAEKEEKEGKGPW